MNGLSKINPKAVNGALIISILLLAAAMVYLACERDLPYAIGWRKEDDIITKNMAEIKELVYDHNMKVKLKVPKSKLFLGIWKDAVRFDEDIIIIFPEDDDIKILDVEEKAVRSYKKKMYEEYLESRYNDKLRCNKYIPFDPPRLKISEFLLEELGRESQVNEDAPVICGVFICRLDNGGFMFRSGYREVPINCTEEDIENNIYPSDPIPEERAAE